MYLLSAFSTNMLNVEEKVTVEFSPITANVVKILLNGPFESAIGHKDTAEILSEQIGVPVEFNRVNVTLNPGDSGIIAQLPRPAEGQVYSKEEILAMEIKYLLVKVK